MAIFDVGIIITALNRASAPLRQVNQQLGDMERNASRASRGMRAIDIVLAGIAAGGLTSFAKKLVETATEMENLRLRFGVLDRDFQKGIGTFKDILKTFERSPIDIAATADAFVRFRTAGIENTKDAVQALTDAVVAFGGTTNEFKRASVAIAQIAGKGTLQMEELRQQLGEAVPTAARILADQLGMSMAKLNIEITKGAIDATTAIEALVRGFQQQYGGLTQTLGKGLAGSLAFIVSQVKQTIDKIFNDTTLGVRLALVFEQVGKAIQKWGESIREADVDRFFNMLINFARVAEGIITALYNIATAVLAIGNAIAATIGAAGAEVLTYGFIAMLLFGRTAGAVAVLIALIVKVTEVTKSAVAGMGAAVQAMVSSFGIAAGFGLIGLLLIGPQGGLIITVVTYLVDQALTILRDLTVRVLNLIGMTETAASVQNTFGKDGVTVFENALKSLTTAMASMQGAGGGTIVDNLLGTQGEAKQRFDEINDAMKRLKETTEKIDLSISAQRSLENLTKLAESVGQSLAGSLTLPFESRIENLKNDTATVAKVFQQEQARLEKLTTAAAGDPKKLAQLDPLRKSLADFGAEIGKVRTQIGQLQASELAKVDQEVRDRVAKVSDVLDKLQEKLAGDPAAAAIADINKQFNERTRDLEKQLRIAERMATIDQSYQTLVTSIGNELARNNALREKSVALETKLQALAQQTRNIESTRAVHAADTEIRDLQRRFRTGLSAMFSSGFADDAQELQDQFRDKLLQIDADITKLMAKRLEQSGQDKANTEAQIAALGRLRLQYEDLAGRVDAFALATQDTMRKVGQAIQDSLVDGIEGFISGTKSAKDVLNDFYRTANKLAIEYLLNLAKIELQQKAMSSGGSTAGGGAGIFGALTSLFSSSAGSAGGAMATDAALAQGLPFAFPAAKGAAFRGRIKPFGKGGLVNGPMMFGLAGENTGEQEGILPLGRDTHGRLGVRGGGGHQYYINITALDGPGVRDLFMREGSALVDAFMHRTRLNRGFRTT